MESRALLPNRSGSPSATLSAAPRRPRPSSPRQIPAVEPDAARLVRHLATVAPPRSSLHDDSSSANPDHGSDNSFSRPVRSRPDNLLLRAHPRALSRLSSHLCALDPSAVFPVTSIRSTARRRPPPPNLNHWQIRACAALKPVPNDCRHHPRSPAPPPSSLNHRSGRALHRFFLDLHAAPPSLSRAAIKRECASPARVSLALAAISLAPCSSSQRHHLSLRNSPLCSSTTAFPGLPATAFRAAQEITCDPQEAPPPPNILAAVPSP
uniref:Uncharacterized protein n=1 Tax=Setaria viridis TaxID=4556 RepID=A0A4U6TMI1_SETVI|nr:hypothetical protein SEVIR_9G574200v2 [Setaria viridis]TKV98657.1 hypothetical protein SEVIR_9G574200v2 [Setaria viridis]